MVAVLSRAVGRDVLPVALAAGAGLALAVWLAKKADLLPSMADVGYGVGSAAVDVVDGVVSGTVHAAGAVVGIPKTNQTQCQGDLLRGDMWEASFSCPAGDFIGAVWDSI